MTINIAFRKKKALKLYQLVPYYQTIKELEWKMCKSVQLFPAPFLVLYKLYILSKICILYLIDKSRFISDAHRNVNFNDYNIILNSHLFILKLNTNTSYRCQRLGLVALSFLWRRNQEDLLKEMIDCGVKAIIIKVAALGKQLSISHHSFIIYIYLTN